MLTKPQATALAKWRNGKPENEVELRVRHDIYWRLKDAEFLQSAGVLHSKITEAGRKALEEYEAKHGQIK